MDEEKYGKIEGSCSLVQDGPQLGIDIVACKQASDSVEAVMDLFVSRDDAHAIQGSHEEIEAGRAYLKVDAPVNTGLIQDHLDGKVTIEVYSISPKTLTTKMVAWDLDTAGPA
jgi:hypothetical protein